MLDCHTELFKVFFLYLGYFLPLCQCSVRIDKTQPLRKHVYELVCNFIWSKIVKKLQMPCTSLNTWHNYNFVSL